MQLTLPTVLIVLACLSALLEWLAIYKGWRKLEYFAKPGVMVFLFALLLVRGGIRSPLPWFGLGILLSLAGDVLLLLSNQRRGFILGLGAFLLAHCAYILGFNSPTPAFSSMTFGVAVMVLFIAMPPARRILLAIRRKGLKPLVEPVRLYAVVISLMLFSALLTLFRTDWLSNPAYLVSFGAVSFVTSDLLLAWNKFVRPVRRGRLLLMITYHIGQLALVAGVIGQYGQ